MLDSPTILIVDDEPHNLQVLKQVLVDSFQLIFSTSGSRALKLAEEQLPDLILLDIMMPGMDGFETCKRLKMSQKTNKIPVIFVTAMSEVESEYEGLTIGAVDYITKPISPCIVRARVKTHLSLVRLEELQQTRQEIIRRLGRAAEFKDNETGLHVIRMSHYAALLGKAYGMSPLEQELLLNASPMHDIGKIGIPDCILLKPGALTKKEWQIIAQHPRIGAEIIGYHESALLKMSRLIALTHHEKWDGSGYPQKLLGEDIPLVGRLVAIADVFDALTTVRPYKNAWPIKRAVDYIMSNSGIHFDPHLTPLFLQAIPQFIEIKNRWEEPEKAKVG
jgi:putative two-component system response regulator